jgi:ribose transport system substrate-binding protein
MYDNKRLGGVLAAALCTGLLAACGSSSDDNSGGSAATGAAASTAASSSGASASSGASWCGDKPITLGIQDGGGLNGWSKASLEQVKLEAAKCKSIKKTIVVNAGFDVQKAISGFNGLMAQGANAIVIIPDAGGPAELPGIKKATARGIKVVPWAASPGGTAGKDYVDYIDWDTKAAGVTWGDWMAKTLKGKGNLIFLGGPAGNAVDAGTFEGLKSVVAKNPGMKLLTSKPAVANWDPAQTQKVTAGLLTKYPNIDGIVVADGQSGAGAIRAFKAAGRKVPPIATLEANEIGCLQQKDKFPLATISARNWLGRYAVRRAVAAANETKDGAKSIVSLPLFEDSEGGKAPICKTSSPPDTFFSNDQPDSAFAPLMGN